MIRTGYAAIIGLPNSGKSTLMNKLLGQKISIVTNKPQTTRKKIAGILSEADYQIIFLDTPGIIDAGYLLQEKMMESVDQALKDADVILLLADASEDQEGKLIFENESVKKLLIKSKKPVLLLLNKIDLSDQGKVESFIKKFESEKIKKIIPISASLSFNFRQVIDTIVEYLPEGPKFYPDDIVSDENERFFVSEIIREKIFELYKEEIPYSTEVLITEFKERTDKKDFISAEIVVERESQKGIIIGRQGSAVKKLGETARKAVEAFLEREIFLELRVKVKSKWRTNENSLKSFGYGKNKE
jgi:GTP-binding protein Era